MYVRNHHKSAPKDFKMLTYDKPIRCELSGIYSGKMGTDGKCRPTQGMLDVTSDQLSGLRVDGNLA